MRTFLRLMTLIGACWGSLVAADTPALTDRTRQALRDRLPGFSPPPTAATPEKSAAVLPARSEGEEILHLPEFRVQERRLAQPAPDDWLSGAELTRKAIRLAERDMNLLDLALNRWHIPLLTPSFAARARGAYEQQRLQTELQRLNDLAELGGKLTPRPAPSARPTIKLPRPAGG